MSSEQPEHKITWYVYAGTELIRRQATMRGTWGYEVKCSCGQESHTGGAVLSYLRQRVFDHKEFGMEL